MTGAVGFLKTGDGLREDLDLAAGRRQRLALRVVAKASKLAAIVGLLGQDQAIARPEFIEARSWQILLSERLPGALIKVLQPLADGAAFGESFTRAEAFGQIGEDSVIVPCFAIGRRDRLHRHQKRVVGAAPNVLAFQRHERG